MPKSSSFLYYVLYITIAFIYPAYCSLNALKTTDSKDDSIWLIYWVVLAIFTVFEAGADLILYWLPFFSIYKLLFLLWCTTPIGGNGAFYIYKVFIEPFFKMYGGHVDYYFTEVIKHTNIAAAYLPDYPEWLRI